MARSSDKGAGRSTEHKGRHDRQLGVVDDYDRANFKAVMKMIAGHCSPAAGRGPTKSPIEHTRFLALAMAGEAGEALNIVKKNWRGDGPLDIEKLVDEVADTLNYGLMLGAFLHRDMLFIMRKKLEEFERKLAERQRE